MTAIPTLSSVLDHYRPLIAAGASLHWLNPFDMIDENGYKRGKTPRARKWSEEPTLDLDGLQQAYRDRSNIGIRLGEPSKLFGFYLHLIDLDIRVIEKADEAWAALLQIWPDARRFPSVISGSRGASRHIYFLSREPFRKLKLAKSATHALVWDEGQKRHVSRNDWEIDLMGTGSQAVLPPSLHPDTALPYEWERPLDLDMLDLGIGPIVPVETIASWGARLKAPATDEDDLETLFNNSPLQLDADEIDEILALIPNDTEELDAEGNLIRIGAHYDDYIEVGMALHHQFEGSEEGFKKWVAWASASTKFDLKHARYRWDKSFGDAKNPVRMATLIQKANNNRLKSDHDFDIEDPFDRPSTALALRPATDLSSLLDEPVSKTSLADLLGGGPVAASVPASEPKPLEGWQSLLARNEDSDLKSNAHNLALIVANDLRTFRVPAFNAFRQSLVLRKSPPRVHRKARASAHEPRNLATHIWQVNDPVNGDPWQDSHDNSIRIMFEAPTTQGGYGIKISDRDLRAALDAAAHGEVFHPVRDMLKGLIWDGSPRVESMFVSYFGCDDTAYYREAALNLMVGAIARVFEPGHKFDFVPILEGAQGKGKSTFIRLLSMGWFGELTGDISDVRMMVENMQGKWIMEIGELSAMHKAEVNDLKQFLSRTEDTARLAYDRRPNTYRRQVVFIGSTNDDEYLRDQTGGRRFWPIKCHIKGEIDNERLRGEVHQIWAEALSIYEQMRIAQPHGDLPLYMRDEVASAEAMLLQESRRVETSEDILAAKIELWLDKPVTDDTGFDDLDPDAPKAFRAETCTAEIWDEMMGNGTRDIDNMTAQKIGRALRKAGWKPTNNVVNTYAVNKRYGRCRVYLRVE